MKYLVVFALLLAAVANGNAQVSSHASTGAASKPKTKRIHFRSATNLSRV